MKKIKNRFLAGALAFLLACSTLLQLGTAAWAADPETKTKDLPELAEIQNLLNEDEIVTAEDITLTMGEPFDGETMDSGMKYDSSKVKVTFEKAMDGNG